MNPAPTESLVQRLYKESNVYRYWSNSVYPQAHKSRLRELSYPRARYISDHIRFFAITPRKIVEIGAGTGDVLSCLKHEFDSLETIAIEPNPSMWQTLEKNGIDFRGVGYQDGLSQIKNVDVICAFEVVEHLLNPYEFIESAFMSLKKGGLLVLSTPNAHSIEIQLTKDDSNTIDIEHISVLTPMAIFGMAKRVGFQVHTIETPGKFDFELIAQRYSGLKLFQVLFPRLARIIQERLAVAGFSSHMRIVLVK